MLLELFEILLNLPQIFLCLIICLFEFKSMHLRVSYWLYLYLNICYLFHHIFIIGCLFEFTKIWSVSKYSLHYFRAIIYNFEVNIHEFFIIFLDYILSMHYLYLFEILITNRFMIYFWRVFQLCVLFLSWNIFLINLLYFLFPF